MLFFFFQAEDGIRDGRVTGVQTCALPICQRLLRHHLACRLQEQVPGRAEAAPDDDNLGIEDVDKAPDPGAQPPADLLQRRARSEERRVGKEWRSRWSPYH